MTLKLFVSLAVCAAVAFALATVTWAVRAARNLPHLSWSQRALWSANALLTRWLWGMKSGEEFELPPGRGVVVCANHRSSVDPFFLMARSRLIPIRWMVAKEFFANPLFGPFLRTCLTIPTNRGGVDTAATRQVVRILESGGRVGMLPEGRINRGDELLLPVRPGAAMVAIKANALILPVYIHGAPYGGAAWMPFFMPARVEVRVGPWIDAAEYASKQEPGAKESEVANRLILVVMREIARLAGNPEFEPKLAGRKWKPGTQADEPDLEPEPG